MKVVPNIIINGGEPLEGFPLNWEQARKWQMESNENTIHESIEWGFDCGFKLDFDGSLVRVVSRFYPPKQHYGKNWNGSVSFYIFDEEIKIKEFESETIDELKEQVEAYVLKEALILLEESKKPKGINLTWYVVLFILGFAVGGLGVLSIIT